MNEIGKKLIELARLNLKNAYCPYSGISVACAVLSKTGNVYTGVNVENSSYGLTVCAERIAIFNSISQGDSQIVAAAIVGKVNEVELLDLSPCGACRQVLSEFMPSEALIYYIDSNGILSTYELSKLLPNPFQIK